MPMPAFTRTNSSRPGRAWPQRLAVVGGVAIVAGSALPWMTMFAGLRRYSGLVGPFGWLLLGVGLVMIATPLLERRGVRWPPLATVLSLGAIALVGYAGTGLVAITRDAANIFMVPRIGPGLPIILAGSVASAVAAMASLRRPQPV